MHQRWRFSQQFLTSRLAQPLICFSQYVFDRNVEELGKWAIFVINQEVRDYLSLTVTLTSGPVDIFLEMRTHCEEEMKHQMKRGGGGEE